MQERFESLLSVLPGQKFPHNLSLPFGKTPGLQAEPCSALPTHLTLLVVEKPFGSKRITSRRRLNQNPKLIPFKIFKFLMRGIDPIGVRKSMSNMFGHKRGNKC